MRQTTVVLLVVTLVMAAAGSARADSCRAFMPHNVEDMTLEDLVCYFVDDMRTYRGLEGSVTASAIAAGLNAASSSMAGAAAVDVDVHDLDSYIDYKELKEDEHGLAANAVAAAKAGGSYAQQMNYIRAAVMATPHFQTYQSILGLSDPDDAFRMLKQDTLKLWNKSERRERELERKRARQMRKGL